MVAEFHSGVLPPGQVRVLEVLAESITSRGFYLAGGTALALQLGHRRSVDFDWFRAESIPDPLQLAAELRQVAPDREVTGTSSNTLHGELAGVRLSWFAYTYPMLEPLLTWDELGCRLASIRDVAAMKLAAMSQRGAKKDFFDLVAIERSGLDLAGMLEAYREKFSIRDIGHVLMALTWFEDAEADPTPILGSADDWESVKAEVVSWVKGT